MKILKNKHVKLARAIKDFIHPGAHISIGGFTISRNPMAAIHEIIRQGIKNLHVYAHSNGQGLDELIGAGAVSKAEIAYSGNGRFAPTCFCFKREVIEKNILIEDYTNYQMALRFLAGSMGIPFLPTYTSLGTDIISKWGFDKQLRLSDKKISNLKLAVIENPFSDNDHEKIVLVPAVNPDVSIIHAQKADATGCTRIEGLTFADVEQARASEHVIVTCEEIVRPGILNQDSSANQLPSFCVDAVVEIPFGAYPTACFGRYDYDARFLDWYSTVAPDKDQFEMYIKDYIMDVKDHNDFLKKACGKRIDQIIADPEKGYSTRLKRN